MGPGCRRCWSYLLLASSLSPLHLATPRRRLREGEGKEKEKEEEEDQEAEDEEYRIIGSLWELTSGAYFRVLCLFGRQWIHVQTLYSGVFFPRAPCTLQPLVQCPAA